MNTLIFAQDLNDAKRLSRLCRQKAIRRIYQGIYTNNLSDPLEKIVLQHWMHLVAHLVPQGILSFRTAMELKPFPYNKESAIVFVTSTYHKTITLPGLIIKIVKGIPDVYTEQILPNLARSNIPRLLLENLAPVKTHYKITGEEKVEEYLAKELRIRKEKSLNHLRDEAKKIATVLKYSSEFKKLNNIISALLTTNNSPHILKTSYGLAVAQNIPYDHHRLSLFESLFLHLKKCHFRDRPYHFSQLSFRNLSFFESYFSNFIEGTEFIIDEAEDIVFQGVKINHRHADSHDVLSLFNLTNDYSEMLKTPENENDFLALLKERHAYLMKERPDKYPGEFKSNANKAGNTYFVLPEEVIGTLSQSFQFYQLLPAGILRALFIHFVISEVHPFNDGNGRLSRIMMNAELVSSNQYKIIIPTVSRDNYLNGLRRATREQDFSLYCKVMDQAQAYSESIDWSDYTQARSLIEEHHADKTPDEGLPIFNRILKKLPLSAL